MAEICLLASLGYLSTETLVIGNLITSFCVEIGWAPSVRSEFLPELV